ncbi:ABC transporter permease [Tumebacillus sp. DT12]|uniref:ABC transporter permease n=1 Tax=Tumebacillus lacus TaxID=2995335 RepID=A0ABT3X0W3_9BACL|nr:ABC transporter permease [Tumebacillus lacus]MCX7569407.1 ABC transporter permease [Tumebacillus lacus]
MSFLQFASNNVRRNARAYAAYTLSSAFAVMIFFMYAMFYFHPGLEGSDLGEMARLGMKAAEYVIFVVSFLFVLYSISSFLKIRQKEFGILTILGAEARQINGMLLLENLMIGLTAILLGIGSGLVLSKLFLLLGSRIIEIDNMPFYWPWRAAGLTLAAFGSLFLVISLLAVALVRRSKLLDLLQGSNKPKPEPTASWLLSLLGLSTFGGAYYMMKQELDNTSVLIILVLGLVGTYLLYSQLSVFFIRLLRKSRPFLWQGTRLLWVSEMGYKMKDNARMFFLVTMVTAMACSSAGIVLALKKQNELIYTDTRFAMTLAPLGPSASDWTSDMAHVDRTLQEEGVDFQKVSVTGVMSPLKGLTNTHIEILPASDYLAVAKLLGLEPLHALQPGQAAVIPAARDEERTLPDTLTAEVGGPAFTVAQRIADPLQSHPMLIVTDADFQALTTLITAQSPTVYYHVPAWETGVVPTVDSQEARLGRQLVNWNRTALNNGETHSLLMSRGDAYISIKQATNILFFVGLFIAAIFSLSTASFLYFRLYTDLQQDQVSYRALSKIGVSVREMQTASTVQIAALFFLPVLVAALETLISLGAMNFQLSLGDTRLPSLIAIGAFLGMQAIYFLLVRSRYLAKLKQVMV